MLTARIRLSGVALMLLVAGCLHPAGKPLGVIDGRLTPCPSSPNCVSSQAPATDTRHSIAPIAFTGAAADAMQRAKQVIETMPRAKIVADRPDYLRVECRSHLWRFVDDLELVPDESRHVLDVRAAARVGHSDFGVNRDRVESLRAKLAAPAPAS